MYVDGDLGVLDAAINYCNENKDWESNYLSWTISFDPTEQDFGSEEAIVEKTKAVQDEMLNFYFPHRNKEDLIFASEMHLPKIQTLYNKQKNCTEQRLAHAHVGVSELDINGNKIRPLKHSKELEVVFQEYLSKKYNLSNPLDNKRTNGESRKDIIARNKGDLETIYEEDADVTKRVKVLKNALISASTVADITRILDAHNLVDDFRVGKDSKGNNDKIIARINPEYLASDTKETRRRI